MSPVPQAVLVALDLFRSPLLAQAVRKQPLPKGVLELIKIAAGCTATCRQAAHGTGEREERLREAAAFYLQHALLFPEADSYRVLGVPRSAPQKTVREHMRWLMRWLHPDRNRSEWESIFAARVLQAWDDLKAPARRIRYDRAIEEGQPAGMVQQQRRRRRSARLVGLPLVAMPIAVSPSPPRSSWLRWSVAVIILVAVTLVFWPIFSSLWGSHAALLRSLLLSEVPTRIVPRATTQYTCAPMFQSISHNRHRYQGKDVSPTNLETVA